ncbi:MAG: hypothetical protein NDJ92_10370 [Thermoanaerobaculia bacterium]|nr:hypothetical protein [Thermoanaerobaculia bacterium]
MDADLIRWKNDKLLQLVILLVGIHSCVLGLAMLFATRRMVETLGFAPSVPAFFPSQSGIFMLILGLFYLRALAEPAYVWTILVSKALAVAFLLMHVLFVAAPPIIWAACAGDAAMLVAVAIMVRRHRRPDLGA